MNKLLKAVQRLDASELKGLLQVRWDIWVPLESVEKVLEQITNPLCRTRCDYGDDDSVACWLLNRFQDCDVDPFKGMYGKVKFESTRFNDLHCFFIGIEETEEMLKELRGGYDWRLAMLLRDVYLEWEDLFGLVRPAISRSLLKELRPIDRVASAVMNNKH